MRARPTKTAKNSVGPISKTNKQTTLHVQRTFLVHFFAVVLPHEYIEKLPKTPSYMFYGLLFTFFSLPLIFAFVVTDFSPFSYRRYL